MISFLKKDEDKEAGGFMGKGDIIFLVVVALLVAGFWYYTKVIKEKSAEHFALCTAKVSATEFLQAESCYEAARNLHYLNDSLDSLIYLNLGMIDSLRDYDLEQYNEADSLLKISDTAQALAKAQGLDQSMFLDNAQMERIRFIATLKPAQDSLRGQVPVP